MFSINQISNIYVGEAEKTIYSFKKSFLKDTVNNLISEIDSKRKTMDEQMEKAVARTSTLLTMNMALADDAFNDFFTSFFSYNVDYEFMTVILWDNLEGKAAYDPQNLSGADWSDTLSRILPTLSTYDLLTHGNHSILIGVTKEVVEQQVMESISEMIRSTKFEDNSYLWVNEILNYDGGDNYAIRRVHSRRPEIEGRYLSTNTRDAAGNLLYLTELEGLKKDGELFFSYTLRDLEKDRPIPKLAYSKLYKDYDWVIVIGIYQDEVQTYIDDANYKSSILASRLTLLLLLTFVIILVFSYALIMMIEKGHYRKSTRELESEANLDPLTKVGNRRSGTNDLIKAFKEFKATGYSPGIMIFDLDYFKSINDQYGHPAGDRVLIEIVNAITEVTRSSDKIIRWGGDEFVIIFNGLQERNALSFGERILSIVSSLTVPVLDDEISPSISIGISFFKQADTSYSDIIERADQALYQSKSNGRNQVHLLT